MEYIIEKEYFKNVVEHQKIKMLSDFNLTPNNDITVDVNFKSYKVNDEAIKYMQKFKQLVCFLEPEAWTSEHNWLRLRYYQVWIFLKIVLKL